MFFSNGDQSNDARQSHCFALVRKRGRTGEEGKGGVMDAVVSEARTPRFSWFVLVLLYLSAIVAPFSMFKVGVLAPALIPALGLDVSEVSVLMSLFNIAGFILAIPGGLLVAKMGAKRSILVSLAFTALGSLLGAFGTNFTFLCFTRVLEGAGLGLVAVCVPSAIAEWFPMRRRGLALGVFTTYVPMGQLLASAIFPLVNEAWGWVSAWWLAAIFGIAMFVLVFAFYRRPTPEERAMINAGIEDKEVVNISFKESLKVLGKGYIWLAGVVFMLFNICAAGGAGQFLTTYFADSLGVSLTVAGIYGAITMVAIIICEPIMGAISDKLGSRKIIVVVPLAGMFIVAWFLYSSTSPVVAILLHALFLGVFSAGVASGTYAAAPEMVDRPEDVSMALGLVALLQNLGLIVGPMAYASVYSSSGFVGVAHFWFMPVLAVAFVIALLTKYRAVPKKETTED